jgi:hypothetical protein
MLTEILRREKECGRAGGGATKPPARAVQAERTWFSSLSALAVPSAGEAELVYEFFRPLVFLIIVRMLARTALRRLDKMFA